MARKLNKRMLAYVLIFIGIPLMLLLLFFAGPSVPLVGRLFSVGLTDPKQSLAEAKALYENKEYAKAWVAIRSAARTPEGAKDPEIQFFMGQVAMKQNPPAAGPAIQAYKTALALKPDHVEAQRSLAELYFMVRYWKEAKAEIDRLVRLDPSFGKAYLWGALVEMALAEAEPIQTRRTPFYEAAIARCQAGLEKAPALLDLYRVMAQVHERMGRSDKVDEVINLAVANNPGDPEAYIMKSSRLIALNKMDEAETVLKKGIEKAGAAPRLFIALGEVAMRKRDPEAAKEFFGKAVQADPKDESGYLRLAGLYRLENEREKAVAALDQGLAQLPKSSALMAEQADLYLELSNFAKADELISRMEKEAPNPGMAGYLKGKRALISRQTRQAITYLEQARDQSPTPQGRLLLGRAYLMADELGAAQRELESLLAEMPRLTPAWRALAEVQFRLRDYDKAARSARIVLESVPDDTEMRILLAQTLVAQQRLPDALREAQTAAERSKDDPDPYLLMAQIQHQLRRPAEAEAMFRRAIAVGKELPRVYQRFLQYYRETNQSDKHKALLEEAKKVLPQDEFLALSGTADEVETELKKRLESSPDNAADMLALARLYQLTDRTDAAREWFEKVLAKAQPTTTEWRQAWQQLFLHYLGSDAYAKASDLVDRLKKVEPDAPELLFADPLMALSRDKLDEAVSQLKAVLQTHKTLSQGHYLLGQVLARQRKMDEAVAALGKALESRPNLIPARLLLARIYYSQGNYSAALAEASAALKFDQRMVPALEMKAAAHAGLGDWASALATREEISRIVPDNVGNLIALAALFLQRHMPEKAEEVFTRAYKIAPDNALLTRALADFYADTGRPQLGQQVIDAYVTRHANESGAHVIRGEYAAKVSGPAEAEKHFRKAAELAPDDPFPFVFLGDQYSRTGEWEKAGEAYKLAVERSKQDSTARKRLADVYMLQGKLDDAKAIIDAVLKNDPKDAAAMVVAGRIAMRQDRPDDARRYIEQALALQPDYGEAKVRLAELYAGPDPLRALEILQTVDPADLSFEKAMLMRADINTRRIQLQEAILDLRRLLDFRPTSVPGRLALAARYMAVQEPARAAELLAQLSREKMDKDASLLTALGDAYLKQEKHREALAAYEKARLIAPESAEALTGEVRCLVSLGRGKEALDRIHQVMAKYPNEVWPRMALVAFYERTGDLEKAFETIRTGLLRREDWEAGYVHLADLLIRANRTDEARQVLVMGLAKVPKSVPIRAGLAALDIGAGRAEGATQILKPLAEEFDAQYSRSPEKIDKLRPYMASIRVYSLALYNQGKVDEALKWGMKLWSVDPVDVANANNMAWILATEKKDFTRATEMIQRCMRLVPNHPQVLDTAGWIYFLAQRYDEAMDLLQASIKYGDNAEARYHLGRVYEARERTEEARAEYQKALQLGLKAKDKEDAEKRLKQLPAAK